MKISKIRLYAFVQILLLFSAMQADLDHICAYSNESVAKFRKKTVGITSKEAVQYCVAKNLIGSGTVYFDWPVDLCEFWVSSLFGPRTHHKVTKHHGGIDLASYKGTRVKSAAPGKVIKAEEGVVGYGNVIEILHKTGMVTRYGHLDEIMVQEGDKVARGEMIGTVGATGNARGKNDPSHLHFEILNKEGKRVNPLDHLYCSEVAFEQK
ncbi:M23 family metallopeptidase [Candidatus Babeliales bacterium]|nr:M23 family metallopeptidase [Candidatus Babeliales bacterium]